MRAAALVLLLAPALAGCLAPPGPGEGPAPLAAAPAARLAEGHVEVAVPVPVVLAGFAPGMGERVRALLAEPEVVAQATLRLTRDFPPDPGGSRVPAWAGLILDAPLVTDPPRIVARGAFRVHEASPGFTAALHGAILAAALPSGAHDANAVEDWLAASLPGEGVPVDPSAPALVLLHGGDAVGPGHGYRYTYPNGWLEPVRAFGERAPLLVLDVSAREDPWVVFEDDLGRRQTNGPWAAYLEPLPPRGEATARALAEAARNATQVRLLKGPVYPVATAPCHAITLLVGASPALTEVLPGYGRLADMLHRDVLEAAWANLTGARTVVDFRFLALPQDDPALDALTRGNLATLDAARWWVDTHWERYWVPHEGCEGYVSLLLFRDAADGSLAIPVQGIGTYDPGTSHRISVSWMSDVLRLMSEGPAAEATGFTRPGQPPRGWVDYLLGHETGHILGQTHTFTADGGDGRRRVIPGFESVWSVMSYQNGPGMVVDFGAVDRNNWMRNRAAYAVHEARAAGLEGDPGFAAALEAMGRRAWAEAGDRLVARLHPAPGEGS